MGVWRNGSASDSRSEGWEFESLCPQLCCGMAICVTTLWRNVATKASRPVCVALPAAVWRLRCGQHARHQCATCGALNLKLPNFLMHGDADWVDQATAPPWTVRQGSLSLCMHCSRRVVCASLASVCAETGGLEHATGVVGSCLLFSSFSFCTKAKQLFELDVAGGHTASNAPDLFRPPKLSGAGLG